MSETVTTHYDGNGNDITGFVLTAEQIGEKLAGKRVRGGHSDYVKRFVKSGEMYAVVNSDMLYRGKTWAQLDTSVRTGIKAAADKIRQSDPMFPRIFFVEHDLIVDEATEEVTSGTLVIVNAEVYEAQVNSDASTEDDADADESV
jgi:hypothetical protein